FRIDVRAAMRWISDRLPKPLAIPIEDGVATAITIGFRGWELFVLTIVLQIGMLPLMARDFHRITLVAPFVNLLAVPLTGGIVPLGFLATAAAPLFPALGKLLAAPLLWLTGALLRAAAWFAQFPRASYRIPGPHAWLIITFFVVIIFLAFTLRLTTSW